MEGFSSKFLCYKKEFHAKYFKIKIDVRFLKKAFALLLAYV